MGQAKAAGVNGRDHYDNLYRTEIDREAEWLDRTAQGKARSVERLLKGHGIDCKSLLELGCGTGSVIKECRKRNLAERYMALDFSETAIEHLRRTSGAGIETFVGDVTAPDFRFDTPVDVIVLSHVIEHLEEPDALLRALRRLDFQYLIAEVPLDDLLMGKLNALGKADRTQNLAGHVQFFTAASFRRLLRSNGLQVLASRRYLNVLDRSTIRFVCRKNGASRLAYYKMALGRSLRLALGPLWSYFFSAHYATLARFPKASESPA